MIRLNLIEIAEHEVEVDTIAQVNITSVAEGQKKSKKKALSIVIGFVFVCVAFCCFLSICGVPKALQGIFPAQFLDLIGAEDPSRSALSLGAGQMTTAGGVLEAQQIAAINEGKRRESLTIKDVVREINHKALYNNSRTEYSSYLPLEQVSFQRASLNQFFTFLATAVPDDVGFSDCIFQMPNFYYMRGVAAKPTSQRSFLERVKSVSSEFRTPPIPENAPATDITAFGLFNVTNANLSAVTKFVTTNEQAEELKAFKTLAATNKVTLAGLDKPAVEDFGVYKRYTYQASSTSDFPELQNFFVALSESPVRVGVTKVEMKFAKKNMQTALSVVMFVAP